MIIPSKLELLIYPDSALSLIATPVVDFTNAPTVKSLMEERMIKFGGVGLAANQVGLMDRFFIMNCSGQPMHLQGTLMIINPVILNSSQEPSSLEEGCLSIPGVRYKIARKLWINLFWQDEFGNEHRERFEDLAAVCVQHEIDHLNGMVMFDHVSQLKKQIGLKKLKKALSGRT